MWPFWQLHIHVKWHVLNGCHNKTITINGKFATWFFLIHSVSEKFPHQLHITLLFLLNGYIALNNFQLWRKGEYMAGNYTWEGCPPESIICHTCPRRKKCWKQLIYPSWVLVFCLKMEKIITALTTSWDCHGDCTEGRRMSNREFRKLKSVVQIWEIVIPGRRKWGAATPRSNTLTISFNNNLLLPPSLAK